MPHLLRSLSCRRWRELLLGHSLSGREERVARCEPIACLACGAGCANRVTAYETAKLTVVNALNRIAHVMLSDRIGSPRIGMRRSRPL
jgi:hypothetical protein